MKCPFKQGQLHRDVDKRKVDFVVLRDRKPLFAVECKTGEKALSPHIPYFKARTHGWCRNHSICRVLQEQKPDLNDGSKQIWAQLLHRSYVYD